MQSQKLLRQIQGLEYIHSTCPVGKRSKFISVVSTVYSRTELMNFGFKISNSQYKKSKDYTNVDFSSLFKPRKRTKNHEIYAMINEYLIKNSSASRTSNNINNEPIYYLNNTKKSIQNKIKEEYPQLKLNLSGFIRLVVRTSKNQRKRLIFAQYVRMDKLLKRKSEQNTTSKSQIKNILINSKNSAKHIKSTVNSQSIKEKSTIAKYNLQMKILALL